MAKSDPKSTEQAKEAQKEREFEKALNRATNELARIGKDIADAVRIHRGQSNKVKGRDPSEVPSLDDLGVQITELRAYAQKFGTGMKDVLTMIDDQQRSYEEIYERETGSNAPRPEPEGKMNVEEQPEADLSLEGISAQFSAELRKSLGLYGKMVSHMRKNEFFRTEALEHLEGIKKEWEDMKANWENVKTNIQGEINAKSQAAMDAVDKQFVDLESRHARVLADAEKLAETPPVEEPADDRRDEERRVSPELERKRSVVAKEVQVTLESLQRSIIELENQLDSLSPSELHTRVGGLFGVIGHTGERWSTAKDAFFKPEYGPLNQEWQAVDDLGVTILERLRNLEKRLPPEGEAERVDRLVRAVVNDRGLWKPELQGRENATSRWKIVEQYTRDGLTFAELDPYFVNARALERFVQSMDQLVPKYKEMLAAKEATRQAEREKRAARPLTAEQLIKSDKIWKNDVPQEARWKALGDFARGELTIEQIAELTVSEEAGAAFYENALRLKEERADACQKTIENIPARLASVLTGIETLKAKQAGTLVFEEITPFVRAQNELWEDFRESLRFLTDIQAAAATTAKASSVRDQLIAAKRELDALIKRTAKTEDEPLSKDEQDPAEPMLDGLVNDESLWQEGMPVGRRRDIIISAVDGHAKERDLRKAIKNNAAFRTGFAALRNHLISRNLLDIVAPRIDFSDIQTEARVARLEELVAKQFTRIVEADFWREGVTEDERRALLSEDSIAKQDDIIKLKDKTILFWARTVQASARRLVELRQKLAKIKNMAERSAAGEDTSAEEVQMKAEEKALDVEIAQMGESGGVVEQAVATSQEAASQGPVESAPDNTLREQAINEHRAEILTLLSDEAFWEPWFANGNVGSRKAAIAKILKNGVQPKREYLRDAEMFKILTNFRSIEDLRSMVARAKGESALQPEAIVTPETVSVVTAPALASIETSSETPPVVPPRRTRSQVLPVEIPAVALPVKEAIKPVAAESGESLVLPVASVESVSQPVAPEAHPMTVVEQVPKVRSLTDNIAVEPSLRPERYFEQDRAARFRLVDDDDELDEPPMRAAEKTSRLASQTVGWFGRLRDRLFGRREASETEQSTLSPQAQSAGGAIATAGRIFGFSAFRGMTDRVPGMSSAERKVIEGAVSRAAQARQEERSGEAALERRVNTNLEAVAQIERSIAASSMSEADKKALRTRLTEAKTAYQAKLRSEEEKRDSQVGLALEETTKHPQPMLEARGGVFLRARDAKSFADTFAEKMRGRQDMNVVSRIFASFREAFSEAWSSRSSSRQVPPSGALQQLGERAGIEPKTGSVDDASLTAGVGGDAAARISQQRIQKDIDALMAAMERRE